MLTVVTRDFRTLGFFNESGPEQAQFERKKNVNFDPKTAVHVNRQQAIDQCPELKFAGRKFRKLKDLSEWIRYDPGFAFTPQHLADARNDLSNFESLLVGKVKKSLGI